MPNTRQPAMPRIVVQNCMPAVPMNDAGVAFWTADVLLESAIYRSVFFGEAQTHAWIAGIDKSFSELVACAPNQAAFIAAVRAITRQRREFNGPILDALFTGAHCYAEQRVTEAYIDRRRVDLEPGVALDPSDPDAGPPGGPIFWVG